MILAKPWYHTAIICAKKLSLNTIEKCKKKLKLRTLQRQVTTVI